MTSVTCNNVRMVTMEGCVNVVGVAGRYLGLEEPVKLIRGWVLLAVSFPRAHAKREAFSRSRPPMCVGRGAQDRRAYIGSSVTLDPPGRTLGPQLNLTAPSPD